MGNNQVCNSAAEKITAHHSPSQKYVAVPGKPEVVLKCIDQINV